MDNAWTDLDDGTQHGFDASNEVNCNMHLSGCEIDENGQFVIPVVEESNNHDISITASQATSKGSKGQATRSKNFGSLEDEVLCWAYLNVSKDPIVGTNQSTGSYWKRIHDYYEENKKTATVRSMKSLQHKWGDISRDTSKFCGFYAEIERKNRSGTSDDDKIKDALQVYEGLHGPFKFLHCWLILRKEQKWNEYLAEKWAPNSKPAEGVAAPTDGEAAGTEFAPVDVNVTPNFVRPPGRDKSKRLRTNESAGSSVACLEVLQKIQSDRAQCEEKLEAQSKDESIEMAARYERKLSLQQESVNIQKSLLEKQVSLQERALALQEKEREDRVMGIDLDKMTPWAKSYYMAQQKEIAEKKGLLPPEN